MSSSPDLRHSSRVVIWSAALIILCGLTAFTIIKIYLAERENQCQASCLKRGSHHYEYTAPKAREWRVGIGAPEECKCL